MGKHVSKIQWFAPGHQVRKDSHPVLWPDELSHIVATATFPYQEHGSQVFPFPVHRPCHTRLSDDAFSANTNETATSRASCLPGPLLRPASTAWASFKPSFWSTLDHTSNHFNCLFSPLSPILQPNQEIFFRGLHFRSLLVFLQFVPFPSFEGNSFNKVINDSTIKWSSVTPEKVTCSAWTRLSGIYTIAVRNKGTIAPKIRHVIWNVLFSEMHTFKFTSFFFTIHTERDKNCHNTDHHHGVDTTGRLKPLWHDASRSRPADLMRAYSSNRTGITMLV